MRCLVLSLLLIGSIANVEAQTSLPVDDWADVLTRFVDDEGRTDFEGLAQDRDALIRYVEWLAKHGPRSTPAEFASAEAVLVYHINAYNALAMDGVIERGIPRNFSNFFKRARFFRIPWNRRGRREN